MYVESEQALFLDLYLLGEEGEDSMYMMLTLKLIQGTFYSSTLVFYI